MPEELGIDGLEIADDFIRCFEKLGVPFKLDEVEKRFNKMSVNEIRDFIHNNNITKLIHVTSSANSESIRVKGIVPRKNLEDSSYEYNDKQRHDKHPDATCLSITNPNDFLFNAFIKRYPDRIYQVLEIDPAILYDDISIKRLYYDSNAASHFSKCHPTNIGIMFKDIVKTK
jgi:hypothetical protein